MTLSSPLSACCKAKIVEGTNFIEDGHVVCLDCGHSCDLQPPAETHIPNDNNQPHSKITNKLTPEMLGMEHAHPVDETEKLLYECNIPKNHPVAIRLRSLESKLRLALDTIDRLATPSGFTAIGVIPEDQWGDELKARIDFAKARLSQIQLLTPKAHD